MWNIIQCAVQGRSHLKADIPCQDKVAAYESEGVTVIALADGAGSACLSHFGAERITQYICRYIADGFLSYFAEEDGTAFKRSIISDINMELNRMAKELGCAVKELASTLLVAGVYEDKYMLVHIGDGVIGYLKEGQLLAASQPENGEFANTTVFTTSEEALQSMKILKGNLGVIDGFVLMSDGTEASLYDKRKHLFAPALKKIMYFSQILDQECLTAQLKDSFENIVKQVTTDDCSIAILTKEKESFRGYRNLKLHEKRRLLGISRKYIRGKQLQKRYDILLEKMQEPRNLLVLAKAIHLNPQDVKKYLNNLLSRNIIVKRNGKYKTVIIMQK